MSTAAHSMYFSIVSVPTRISTDPGHGTRNCSRCCSYSYFRTDHGTVEAFSLCMFLTSTNFPSGPPWNEGHRPRVRHETSVFEVPVQEQHEHSFYSSSTNTFITGSLYTVCRYCTSPGAPDLLGEVGLTPRQYTEWNVVGCAHALLEIPLSRGCCQKCTILPVQGGVLTYSTEC